MQKKFFINHAGLITGPFAPAEIAAMLKSEYRASDIKISSDKINWQSWQEQSGLTDGAADEDFIDIDSVYMPQPGEYAAENAGVALEPPPVAPVITFPRILALAFSGPFNPAAVLKELSEHSPGKVTIAGFCSLSVNLLTAFLCGVIFARFYNTTPLTFTGRFLLFTLLAGIIFYLLNNLLGRIFNKIYTPHHHAINFCAAMVALSGTVCIAGVLCAGMFFFNRSIFASPQQQILLLSAIILLPLIFFTANAVTALRLTFMASDDMRSVTATLWAVIGLYLAVMVKLFLFFPFITL